MCFGNALRQKVPIIRFLVEFQKTIWYPIIFAILCVISGTNGYKVYLPIMVVLCAFVLFSVLFTDDNKVFLVPLFMIYFAVGFDNPPYSYTASNGDMFASFNENALKGIIGCAVVIVTAFLIRLICDGSIKAAFTKRCALTVSILAMDMAFVLNGILGPESHPKNLLYGLIISSGITLVYFLVHGMLHRSTDVVTYGCKVAVCASYVVLAQILVLLIRTYLNDTLFFTWGDNVINRMNFYLGWGVTTVVGAILVLGVPAAFYLARKCKFSGLLYLSGLLFVMGTFVLDSRSSIVVGAFAAFCGIVLSCFRCKNKLACRIYAAIIVLLPIGFLIYLFRFTDFGNNSMGEILRSVFELHKGDSGRIEMWKNGIADFLNAPVFGIGFNNGGYATPDLNVYSNMYHCIGIEFLGATGIFGCLAFLFHIFELFKLFFRRFSIDKILLMLAPAMIIVMSLVDNFFFYFNFQIFYGAFLAFAEISIKEKEDALISDK